MELGSGDPTPHPEGAKQNLPHRRAGESGGSLAPEGLTSASPRATRRPGGARGPGGGAAVRAELKAAPPRPQCASLVRAAARAPEPSGAAQGRVETSSSRRVASPV